MSATDVVVQGFSIAAPAKALLTNASLRLASGRRYGLLGPNGRGKSTLLRFLSTRRLPVPAGVDVLLVEQEDRIQTEQEYLQVMEGLENLLFLMVAEH